MCGIFGYIGNKDASAVVTEGLKRLEYRGYDSWGIAVSQNNKIVVNKKTGSIGSFEKKVRFPNSKIGIGHTRWATHGSVNHTNAHPHFSSDKSFILAQNGIVENFATLKDFLTKKGHKFTTDTDTEVIVRLIEEEQKHSLDLQQALKKAFIKLTGRNTVIILTDKNEVLAARNGSPLVLGVSDSEIFISSDTLSFAQFAKKVIVLDNGQGVFIKPSEDLQIFDIKSGRKIKYQIEDIDFVSGAIDKLGFPHFMLKEINDTPQIIRNLAKTNIQDYSGFIKATKDAENIYTIGSGTAGVAAAQIAFYLRNISKIRATALIGSDSSEYLDLITKKDLIIVPSQSGETADVLEVLEKLRNKGVKVASLVNMPGSTISRLSDYKFMMNAGPEICVMSTKVFTFKLAWGYLISKILIGQGLNAQKKLLEIANNMESLLKDQVFHQQLKSWVTIISKCKDIFLMGKLQNIQVAKEGMIKIIEGAYLHAHAIPAGDLKHYAITLMEKGVPVIVSVSQDAALNDMINSIMQVSARGASVFAFAPSPHKSFDYHIQISDKGDASAILNIIPLQLLAYYLSVQLGNNVDKPRNIAKSVTVK